MGAHTQAAVVIMCAGRGGRCRRQLGVARIQLLGDQARPVMSLSNEGWATSNDIPLLEASVPSDFSGSTGIFECPDHGYLITERSGDPPISRGFPAGSWAKGMSVQFPFYLLKRQYADHLHSGQTQEIKWVPRPDSAVLADDHV